MDIDLDFIFVELKLSKDSQHWADSNILLSKPRPEITLPFGLVSIPAASHGVAIIVKPEDASHNTSGIIYSKEKPIVFPDLEYDGASNWDFG